MKIYTIKSRVKFLNRAKIKDYLGICNKAGYLIIGADNLKKYSKKLYLLLVDELVSKNLQKVMNKFENTEVQTCLVSNLSELVEIENCKMVGIKNHGLAQEILKNIRGE